MTEEKHQEPIEYKLLIEFVYQKKGRFFKKMRYPVQNKPFKFGLRVKNIDEKSSPNGKINNLSISTSGFGAIKENRDEKFVIPELNPGQEIILWWPDELTTILKGGLWVDCSVEPKNIKSETFITFQYDPNCSKEYRYKDKNAWGNGLFIRGELEQQQAKTNFLMLLLTAFVFFDGVWGLDIIFKTMFSWSGWLLSQIGIIFSKLGS